MEAHIRSIVASCEKYDAFYTFTAEDVWLRLWSHYDNVQNEGIL